MAVRMNRLLPLAVAASLIAQPALALENSKQFQSDTDAVVQTLNGYDQRVLRIGTQLATAGVPLCASPGFALGLAVQHPSLYAPPYRDAAARLLGVRDGPTISVIVPGSASDKAGLKVGDLIVSVDSRPVADNPPPSEASFAASDAAASAIDAGLNDGKVTFDLRRGGQPMTIIVAGTPACRVRFDVRASGSNASANGTYVQIETNLVEKLKSDGDLAAIIAHEMSHNILGHAAILESAKGGVFAGFGRSGRLMRATEIEADRLSMYLLALAGYPLDDALQFWTKFTRSRDFGILSDRTHPGWRDRIAAMTVEAARIADLRRRGEPVRPDFTRLSETTGPRPPAQPR